MTSQSHPWETTKTKKNRTCLYLKKQNKKQAKKNQKKLVYKEKKEAYVSIEWKDAYQGKKLVCRITEVFNISEHLRFTRKQVARSFFL